VKSRKKGLKMKTKQTLKTVVTTALCFLLFMVGIGAVEVKSLSPEQTKNDSTQKPKIANLQKPTDLQNSMETKTLQFSTLTGKWENDKTSEWLQYTIADEDSAEIVIGINPVDADNYQKLTQIAKTNGAKIVNTVKIGNKTEAIVVDTPLMSISSFVTRIRDRKSVV